MPDNDVLDTYKIDDIEELEENEIEIRKENIAGTVGFYIVGTFALCNIIIVLGGIFLPDTKYANLLEMAKAFNQFIAGPLGFILGYYFTKNQK